jgi:hypothetical protein
MDAQVNSEGSFIFCFYDSIVVLREVLSIVELPSLLKIIMEAS